MALTKPSKTPPPVNSTAPPTQAEREQAIRARAYAIWHQEGQPDGRHDTHWAQAEQEHDRDAGDS